MGPLDHVAALGNAFDDLGVPWVLGGSLASSQLGEPRSTNDVDIAVSVAPTRVEALAYRIVSGMTRYRYFASSALALT